MSTDAAGAVRRAAGGAGYRGPSCPRCWQALELDRLRSGRQWCPRCAREFEAVRFEPPRRESRIPGAGGSGPGGAFACPAHKGNAAVASCERCGVFVCGLCRIDLESQAFCPACFDRVVAGGEQVLTRNRFRDFEALGWLLSLAGLLCMCTGVVTGPAAVFCALKARRQRLSWGDAAHNGRLLVGVALGLASLALSVAALSLLVRQP